MRCPRCGGGGILIEIGFDWGLSHLGEVWGCTSCGIKWAEGTDTILILSEVEGVTRWVPIGCLGMWDEVLL